MDQLLEGRPLRFVGAQARFDCAANMRRAPYPGRDFELLPLEGFQGNLDLTQAFEGALSGEKLPHDYAERVNIGLLAIRFIGQNLPCHPLASPSLTRHWPVLIGRLLEPRQPKVTYFGVVILVQKDVCGLQVSVKYRRRAIVKVGHPASYTKGHPLEEGIGPLPRAKEEQWGKKVKNDENAGKSGSEVVHYCKAWPHIHALTVPAGGGEGGSLAFVAGHQGSHDFPSASL